MAAIKSIEEKAKAYDEAYKRVAVRFGSNVADEIFPELKESEGERIRKFLIGYFDRLIDENSEWGLEKETRKKVVAWLEKQGEQKPVWSEEDEKMLNDILMCGEHHCYLDAGNIDWLKSLRPQNRWKPSDEQMYILNWVTNLLNDGIVEKHAKGILESLYSDLKKLK